MSEVKYLFYKLSNELDEWAIDVILEKKERRFISTKLTDECIKSLENKELTLDNPEEESIIKHKGCTFSFYKEFKIASKRRNRSK